MYRNLSNNPEERANITYSWTYWDDAFTEDELKKIEEICLGQETQRATIIGTQNENEVEKVRKSKVYFHTKNEKTDWLFDKFNAITSIINDRYYNYNLNGYKDFQYTEYYAEENGKYDWHMDMIHGPNNMNTTRKLSIVFCLSEPNKDFTGGEFQINTGNAEECETVKMKKGRMIFFPSYLIHRVKPVTQGIRKTIVIWVTGPKFI